MENKFSRRKMLHLTGKVMVLGSVAPDFCFAEKMAGSISGAVASDPLPVKIGEKILAEGGNAIDAAVGAAFAAGVAIPSKTGIGGYGGAMVIALANGKTTCIDFNMVAPAAARPDMFPLDNQTKVVRNINSHGWLAAGVPGTCAGLQMAIDRYGTKSLRELLQPAIALAQSTVKPDKFVDFPALARTLSTLAERNSVDSFYRGDIAQETADAFQKGGGLVTTKDLAAYQAREVVPYQLPWKDRTLYTAPLGASGLMVLQMLSILKALKWNKIRSPLEATHARLEAMRLVWKDRFEIYGDPDHSQMPVKIFLSHDYAVEQARRIEHAVKQKAPLPLQIERVEQVGTLHISVADQQGNLVSLTLTQGNGYGAQVSVRRLGMVLGNGMARFDPRPGKPNSIGPRKRPVHNMCPMILARNGKPTLAVGAAGGTKIPNSLYDFFVQYLGQSQSMEKAVDQPRMNCLGTLDVFLEKEWPVAEAEYLKKIGFQVQKGLGAYVSAVEIEKRGQARAKSHVGNPFQEKP